MKSKFLPAFILLILAGHLAFAAGPTITSFSPAAGQVGTLVTITGTNLSTPTTFTIGGVAAIVVSDNGTQLVGMIMPGAANGPVSVTAAGAKATSTTNFTVNPPTYPTAQQAVLSGTQATYYSEQGSSVAISADGSTAIVGAVNDNGGVGSSYIYTRNAGVWAQQAKLVGTGEYINYGMQGNAVALSADGNTAMVGGYSDGSTYVGTSGFVWFFTRTGTTWTQQGSKVSGTGGIIVPNGVVFQGFSVSLSADGNTAIESGPKDNGGVGATWIFTRSSSGVWTQLGSKMVIPGTATAQGSSVAISADASTIIVGCSGGAGGAYVYTYSGNNWVLQGTELTVAGSSSLGASVAVSADGNTALLGAPGSPGAWAFTRTGGVWSQFGSEFTFPGAINASNGGGAAVALSADGNTAVVGAPANGNQYAEGGTWIYVRSGNNFVNEGGLILGANATSANAAQGTSVAISATGTTAISGGPNNNNYTGFVFVLGAVVPMATTNAATNITSSSANINGYVTTSGAGLGANTQFEWGTDPNLVGSTITTTFSQGTNPVAPNSSNDSFSSYITGLAPQTTYYFRIDATNINGTGYGVIKSFTTAVAPPISLTTGTVTGAISACTGAPSASPFIQQFTVTAVSLTTGVSVTAPIGFQVSNAAATGYSNNIIMPGSGGSVNQVVYVRSAAGDAPGAISGNVAISSTGITTANVAVTGTVHALAIVNTVANQTISGGTATAAVNFTGTANTFDWTNDTPTIGLATSGTGNIPSFTAINTGNAPVKATVTVSPVNAGFAYITNTITSGANISPVNTISDAVTTPIPAGNSPFGVTISPDGSKAYITNSAGAAVSVVSTATNQVTATVNLAAYNPYGIAVSSDGTKLYTSNFGQNNVTVINALTNTLITTFPVAVSPFGIVVSPDGSMVYVACSGSGVVEGISTATNTVTAIIPTGTRPLGVALSPDGTIIYVANANSGTVSIVNTQTFANIATVTVGTNPYGITVSPDGSKVYVSNNTSNNVSVINTTTNTVSATVLVGQAPRGVSTSPDGTLLYVANYTSGTMSIINTATDQVISTVTVGSNPTSLGNFVTGNGCTGPPITFTITVDPKALPAAVITFNQPPSQQYGSADFAPGATSTNTVTPITYTSSNTAVATIVNGNIHVVGTGTIQITASQAASSTYGAAVPVMQNFTVTPAPLVITAVNQTKKAGTANPVFTATYATFVNGDTEADLTTPPNFVTTATTGSPVGSYPITVSGAVDNNYTITYAPGTLSVVNAPTAITLAATSLSPTGATLNGTVNDNGAMTTVQMEYSLSPDLSGAINVPLTTGLSPIAAGTGTVSFSSVISGLTPQTTYYFQTSGTNNYGTTNGNIVKFITPAVPLTGETITFNQPPSQVYGSADVNPGATSTNTTIPITYTSSNTAVATIVNGQIHIVGIGSTQITASQAGNNTYSPATPVKQPFTVTPALLTVMPVHQTKVYGTANPTLTVTYKGFVNGDNVSSLTTQATVTTSAISSSGVGNYSIDAGGAADPNYTFNYVADTLTITPATLLITVVNYSRLYGAANPVFTASYSGFVNGDAATKLTTQPAITTTAVASSPVGSYPIAASGAVDANYNITYKGGTLSITSSTLTITAVNETKIYGAVNPYLAVSYTGFIAGDDSTKLTTPPTVTTSATISASVGSYTITVSGAVDANYTINYVSGTLKVTPASLLITANNQTKLAGAANPALTVSYSGFVNGDAASNLTTQPLITTTATVVSQAGTYPITVSGAVDANYSISYVAGTLTVNPLLVLNPFPPKTYGDPDFNPNATGTNITYTSGNSGVATIINGEVHITGAGSVVITATSGNTSVQQTLVINKAPLLITANNETKIYGTANPTLSVSYDKFVYSDDSTSLSVQPVVTTAATTTSDVGSYPITVSGASANNYAITYQSGTLNITQATQTITFAPIPDQIEPAVYDLSAITASSGLPVNFTLSNSVIASISGTSLTSVSPGMEIVVASQPGNNDYTAAASVSQTYLIKEPDNGDVLVAQVVSPNGDGINDVLNVINIQFYPDNKLILINRNGVKIYEATGYNNKSVVFDGRSSITGALQQQGTYLYVLEYRVNGELKRKTGFTVLRY